MIRSCSRLAALHGAPQTLNVEDSAEIYVTAVGDPNVSRRGEL